MTQTDVHAAIRDLEAAGADPKLAQAIARHAFRTERLPAPIWPVPVISAVLVAAIGIVGVGVYKNGDRIDAVNTRIDAVNERVATLEVSVTERLVRIETLLSERLPERR